MLKTLKQRLRWHGANFDRMVAHRFDQALDADLRPLAKTLREDGIVTCDVRMLLGPDAAVFDALREETVQLWQSDAVREKAMGLKGEKKFKVRLLKPELDLQHPAMRISLHPRVLSLVNDYMGLHSYLRHVDLWWDRPTPEEAAATQLWHRDLDDSRCIKAFIYFNDVDSRTGPFTYMPGTHMFGAYASVQPGGSDKNRFTDAEMTAPISMDKARVVTGSAGTMILCDTYGFHRGVKPEKDRLMSIFQYVSKASKYPREFQTNRDLGGLIPIQARALDPIPSRSAN